MDSVTRLMNLVVSKHVLPIAESNVTLLPWGEPLTIPAWLLTTKVLTCFEFS